MTVLGGANDVVNNVLENAGTLKFRKKGFEREQLTHPNTPAKLESWWVEIHR